MDEPQLTDSYKLMVAGIIIIVLIVLSACAPTPPTPIEAPVALGVEDGYCRNIE